MSGNVHLIAEVLAGSVSGEDQESLIELLKQDGDLRRKWASHAEMEGWLGIAMEAPAFREEQIRSTMDRLQQADHEAFVAGVRDRVEQVRWKRRVLAMAAVATMAFLTVFSWNRLKPVPVIATLERQESAVWKDGSAAPGILAARSRLQLSGGLVELQIADKGRMILEGPADLEFVSAGHSILWQGRVVMRVTESGHGYRLQTPGGSVVDLGTEFGVSVGASGAVETHVLEGQVEATSAGGGKVILNKDDGLRFANGGAERITSGTGSFYTVLPPRHQASPSWVHWSFEGGSDMNVPGRSEGFEGASFSLKLAGLPPGSKPAPEPGVFGGGLSFDGMGSYAESEFKGIGGKAPRTVCFWVKVPADFSPSEGYGILSWGRFEPLNPGGTWQVSINPEAADGPIGRLRVGAHRGQVIGSTDLRDGKWHHIAVVMYPGSHPDVGKHVLLYVDGALDEVSQRALREIDTEIGNAEHGVWLGRNVSHDGRNDRPQSGGFFRGSLDEVFIFGAALSSEEIRQLMETNQVPR